MGSEFEVAKKLLSINAALTDDTRIHQLNRLGCVIFFVLVALVVSSTQIVGNPIQCWCPAQFTEYQAEYINDYCWIRNTYTIDFNSSLPENSHERIETEIQYYQWLPIILIFQAFLFYFPRLFWKTFSEYSSLNIKKLLSMTNDATYETGDQRQELINNTVNYFQKYLKIRNMTPTTRSKHEAFERIRGALVSLGIQKGSYLVFVFTLTSLLYMISAFSQIFIVDSLLGVKFTTLGSEFLTRASRGESLLDQNRFPIVTFCDVELRQMTNLQAWTVQCSLPVNLFSEKIFILDWFLLVIMTIVNTVYFLCNCTSVIMSHRAEKHVWKFMEVDGLQLRRFKRLPEHMYENGENFIHNYLKHDGVFLIWLTSNKLNPIIAGEIVSKLWNNYTKGY